MHLCRLPQKIPVSVIFYGVVTNTCKREMNLYTLTKSIKPFISKNDHVIKGGESVVNEMAETEFKHSLRERRKEFNEFIELIEKGDIDELKKKLQAEVDVITETLGD